MAGFDVQRVIAAYQAGQQVKRQQEQKEMEAEDRKFEMEKRGLELKALKLAEKMRAREEAIQTAGLQQGQPAEEFGGFSLSATPGGVREDTEAPVGPDMFTALTGRQRPQAPTFTAPIAGASQPPTELPLAPVTIPGVQGPDTTVQPQSMQDLLRMQRRQKIGEKEIEEAFRAPTIIPEGAMATGGTFGTQVIENPKEPTDKNPQFRDVERGGRVMRQYFQGDPSKVLFEVDTGAVKDRNDDPLTAYQRNQTFVNISNKYQADQIVNLALKGKTASTIADQIIANPSKATNQLAAIYLYVKNLDPDSAVREGELELAQRTQSYLQKFGTTLERIGKGQLISDDAAKELALATKQLVAAWEQTAGLRTNQYKSQATVAGVGSQFDQYLKGFEKISGSGGGGAANPYR